MPAIHGHIKVYARATVRSVCLPLFILVGHSIYMICGDSVSLRSNPLLCSVSYKKSTHAGAALEDGLSLLLCDS